MSNTNTSTDRIPVFKTPNGKIQINTLSEKDKAKLMSTLGKVKQLDKVSDLGKILSYLKKLQLEEEVIEFNGQQYLVRSIAPAEGESELPALDEVVDYYGLKDLIETVAALKGDLSKTGDIKATLNLADNLDNGWLLCNGAQISRTTYKNLWEFANDNGFVRAVETIADLDASEDLAFGPGDGSTTFSLPNLVNRYIMGSDGTNLSKYIKAQLPNITGSVEYFPASALEYSGALNAIRAGGNTFPVGGPVKEALIDFHASRSNAIYTNNSKVYPLSLVLNFIIKS